MRIDYAKKIKSLSDDTLQNCIDGILFAFIVGFFSILFYSI